MKEPSDSISTPLRPTENNTSKKRELSSPFSPEDKLSKKNKADSDSESDGEISNLGDAMDSLEAGATSQTHMLTLPEAELQKLSDLIKPAIEGDVLTAIRDGLKSIVKDAVKEAMDEKLKHLNTENKRLSRENTELKGRVTKLEQAVDDAEQYSRRNCLRISKFPEHDNENTDEIVLKVAEILNVNISPAEIDRSHRIGKPGARTRDVIVKFTTYRARERLYTVRANLKNSDLDGIFLNEDLTRKRSKLLYEARKLAKAESPCLLGAWSTDGKILVKDLRSKVHRISSDDELDVVKTVTADDQDQENTV